MEVDCHGQAPPDDCLEVAGIKFERNGTPAREALAVAELAALHRENDQLRRALASRATIDQAKGVLMAEHGGPPEDAFRRLPTMSPTANVPLREVASAVVYEAANRT